MRVSLHFHNRLFSKQLKALAHNLFRYSRKADRRSLKRAELNRETLDGFSHGGQKRNGFERLGNHTAHERADVCREDIFRRETGHDEDGHVGATTAEELDQLDTRYPGHGHVGNDEIHPASTGLELGHSSVGSVGANHAVAVMT